MFNKAWSLGLRHGYGRPFSDDEDRAIQLAHARGLSLTDLSVALGRDPAVVSKHAIRIGAPFHTRTIRAPRGKDRSVWTLAAILDLGTNDGLASGAIDPAAPVQTPPKARTGRRTATATTRAGTVAVAPAIDESDVCILLEPYGRPAGAAVPTRLLPAMHAAGLLRIAGRAGAGVLLTPI